MRRKKDPARGKRIEVLWIDICEDSTGNPDEAQCVHRCSTGYFWGRKTVDYAGISTEQIVTTTTLDPDGHQQQGWCCYPVGAILGIRVLR